MNRRHLAFAIAVISVFAGLIVRANATDWSSNISVQTGPRSYATRPFDSVRFEMLCVGSYVLLVFGVLLAVALIYQWVNQDPAAKIIKA